MYESETRATEEIRRLYPDVGQRTLARIITSPLLRDVRELPGYEELSDVDKARLRSLLVSATAGYATVYNRIRRIDKAKAKNNRTPKPGDRVRLLEPKDRDHALTRGWIVPMFDCIGEIGEVVNVRKGGVSVEFNNGHIWTVGPGEIALASAAEPVTV